MFELRRPVTNYDFAFCQFIIMQRRSNYDNEQERTDVREYRLIAYCAALNERRKERT